MFFHRDAVGGGVILTANYTFLNYLVMALGFLLLDDKFLQRIVPARFRPHQPAPEPEKRAESAGDQPISIFSANPKASTEAAHAVEGRLRTRGRNGFYWHVTGISVAAFLLTWIAYDTTAEMIEIPLRDVHLPAQPIVALDPFRIANQYGLFAVMTHGRYEIEFQGSNDGVNWVAYPFRNKPQTLNEAPRIYAPYQPRFDWNLWFASLGNWRENQIVPITEERLLLGDRDVLALFRNDPFPQMPPRYVRAVLWQYWFTSEADKRKTGKWWRRELLGLYAPEITLTADGQLKVVEWPEELPEHD